MKIFKMKYLLASLLILLTVSFTNVSYAQTPTAKAPSPTSEKKTEALSEQISDLKEKIASRVAQLDLVEKRGIVGSATEIEDTQINLTDIYGDTRFVDVDEITEFSSDEDDFGISDIEPGDIISVLGLYNKQSERVLARFITVITVPTFVNGTIDSLNEDDFMITIKTATNETYTVEIETSTATREYDGEDFVKSGFSRLEKGEQVFVTGFADEDDPMTITATRVLAFPTEDSDPVSPTPEE